MTLTRLPGLACSGVMLLALPLLVLFLIIIKLERRSRICALGHLVPQSTAHAARGVYGALVIPSQSDRVPPPSSSGPASHTRGLHPLSLKCVPRMWGCHETQSAPRH